MRASRGRARRLARALIGPTLRVLRYVNVLLKINRQSSKTKGDTTRSIAKYLRAKYRADTTKTFYLWKNETFPIALGKNSS